MYKNPVTSEEFVEMSMDTGLHSVCSVLGNDSALDSGSSFVSDRGDDDESYNEGFRAAIDRQEIIVCSYPVNSVEYLSWMDGHSDGCSALTEHEAVCCDSTRDPLDILCEESDD